eukprot:5108487-Pleurochrysis_carterae.AAC.1
MYVHDCRTFPPRLCLRCRLAPLLVDVCARSICLSLHGSPTPAEPLLKLDEDGASECTVTQVTANRMRDCIRPTPRARPL